MKSLNDGQIREIKKLVDYRGRKVHLREFKVGMSLNSYWDSGSRDYFYWVQISGSHPSLYSVVPQNGTPYDRLDLKTSENTDTDNLVLVEKVVIRGRDAGIYIYSR